MALRQKMRDALKRQAAHGESLRDWMEDNFRKSEKKREEAKRERENAPISGGASRVPPSIKYAPVRSDKAIVSHADANHASRRRNSQVTRDERGRAHRRVQSGYNQPYYNPERADVRAAKRIARQQRRREVRRG